MVLTKFGKIDYVDFTKANDSYNSRNKLINYVLSKIGDGLNSLFLTVFFQANKLIWQTVEDEEGVKILKHGEHDFYPLSVMDKSEYKDIKKNKVYFATIYLEDFDKELANKLMINELFETVIVDMIGNKISLFAQGTWKDWKDFFEYNLRKNKDRDCKEIAKVIYSILKENQPALKCFKHLTNK